MKSNEHRPPGRPAWQSVIRPPSGYSLVEVLIGGAVLAMAILAAALLAAAILVNQENDGRSMRSLNLQEQYAKLYHLGLHPTNITNIIPERIQTNTGPGANGLSFLYTGPTNSLISGAGNMTLSTNTMIFHSGTDANGSIRYTTNVVILVRPSIL